VKFQLRFRLKRGVPLSFRHLIFRGEIPLSTNLQEILSSGFPRVSVPCTSPITVCPCASRQGEIGKRVNTLLFFPKPPFVCVQLKGFPVIVGLLF